MVEKRVCAELLRTAALSSEHNFERPLGRGSRKVRVRERGKEGGRQGGREGVKEEGKKGGREGEEKKGGVGEEGGRAVYMYTGKV